MTGDRGDRLNEKERGRAVAETVKVRTTFEPGKVIEISAAELVDLERQGLIDSRVRETAPAKTKEEDSK